MQLQLKNSKHITVDEINDMLSELKIGEVLLIHGKNNYVLMCYGKDEYFLIGEHEEDTGMFNYFDIMFYFRDSEEELKNVVFVKGFTKNLTVKINKENYKTIKNITTEENDIIIDAIIGAIVCAEWGKLIVVKDANQNIYLFFNDYEYTDSYIMFDTIYGKITIFDSLCELSTVIKKKKINKPAYQKIDLQDLIIGLSK